MKIIHKTKDELYQLTTGVTLYVCPFLVVSVSWIVFVCPSVRLHIHIIYMCEVAVFLLLLCCLQSLGFVSLFKIVFQQIYVCTYKCMYFYSAILFESVFVVAELMLLLGVGRKGKFKFWFYVFYRFGQMSSYSIHDITRDLLYFVVCMTMCQYVVPV